MKARGYCLIYLTNTLFKGTKIHVLGSVRPSISFTIFSNMVTPSVVDSSEWQVKVIQGRAPVWSLHGKGCKKNRRDCGFTPRTNSENHEAFSLDQGVDFFAALSLFGIDIWLKVTGECTFILLHKVKM